MPDVYITVGLRTDKEIDRALIAKLEEDIGRYGVGVLSDVHLTGKEELLVCEAHSHTSSRKLNCDPCLERAQDRMNDRNPSEED